MVTKNKTSAAIGAAVATALMLAPAGRAAADAGDFIGGLIVGGAVGHLATKEAQRKRAAQQRTVVRQPVVVTQSATRAENREVQASLNYFGFAAGTEDGILGRRSRAAVGDYQVYMGFPATGTLTTPQRSFLLSSYDRAQLGGTETSALAATDPDGTKSLLLAYRDEALGGTNTTLSSTSESGGLALPSFAAAGGETSLASHCNTVSLITTSNGGYVTANETADSGLALNEQFCLARAYAIAESDELAEGISNITPAVVAQQCAEFGASLKPQVAALSLKPRDDVMSGLSQFVLSSGADANQLRSTALVCLGAGYKADDMDTAIGSAMVLAVVGEPAYAELLGHHLGQGFGTAARTDLSLGWYDLAYQAIEDGAVPVFDPGDTDRHSLVWSAAYRANGLDVPGADTASARRTAFLPTFTFD